MKGRGEIRERGWVCQEEGRREGGYATMCVLEGEFQIGVPYYDVLKTNGPQPPSLTVSQHSSTTDSPCGYTRPDLWQNSLTQDTLKFYLASEEFYTIQKSIYLL